MRQLRALAAGSGQQSPRAREAFANVRAEPLAPEVLDRFERRLNQLSDRQREALDPLTHPDDFKQPNDVSCGATCLVVARMINDPPYALWLTTGFDPRTNATDGSRGEQRIEEEIKRMHKQITSARDHDGDPQVPWLRLIGTAPWAAARQMYGEVGASGVPGSTYRAHTLNPVELARDFDTIAAAARAGHSVPLYIGDELRPGHVVLVTEALDDQTLQVFEPAHGQVRTVTKTDFSASKLGLAGWSTPWFAVLPQ